MNKIKMVGYLFALLGVGAFAVSLFNISAPRTIIADGGIILFSLGMAMLLSAISYTLGMDMERAKIRKNTILSAPKATPASSSLLVCSPEEDNSSSAQ